MTVMGLIEILILQLRSPLYNWDTILYIWGIFLYNWNINLYSWYFFKKILISQDVPTTTYFYQPSDSATILIFFKIFSLFYIFFCFSFYISMFYLIIFCFGTYSYIKNLVIIVMTQAFSLLIYWDRCKTFIEREDFGRY